MKILLTGACGLLGRAVRRVCGQGHQLVLLDMATEVVEAGGIRGTITDPAVVLHAAKGCDAIIHTAAMHRAYLGKATHVDFLRVNVLGAENLFHAALRHNIRRLVLSSTLEVLIGSHWDSVGSAVLNESLPPRPDSIYPLSKLMVEQLGDFYAQYHGLEVIHLRYCALYEKSLEELGFGLLARHLAVDDAARANVLAVTRPGLRNEVFNIVPDSPLTEWDYYKSKHDPWAVLEHHWPGCGEKLRARGLDPAPHHFSPLNCIDKAKLILGWQPQATFEKFLRHLGWQGEPRTQWWRFEENTGG